MSRPCLTPQKRLAILKSVFEEGQKVSVVCRKVGISRFTFYNWAKKYHSTTTTRKVSVLSDAHLKGEDHPRFVSSKSTKLILDLVLRHPLWSSHKISDFLKKYKGGRFAVSNHGVQRVLARHGLNRLADREEFVRRHPVKSFFASKLSDFEKYKILEEAGKDGIKIADVCRRFHICRYTYYAWLAKYNSERTIASLADRRPRGEVHPRYISGQVKEQVLNLVSQKPHYSVHQLARELEGTIGHHGIQNVLLRDNLNTYDKRLVFAQGYIVQPAVKVAPLYQPTMHP